MEKRIVNLNQLSSLTDLLKGGNSAKFESPGDTHTGTITKIEVKQATDFSTGEPLFWTNGDPRQQVVVTIQTSSQTDEDDGTRAVFVKTWGDTWMNFRKAVQAVYGTKSEPGLGDQFTATYIADGEVKTRGHNAPKILDFEFVKKTPGLAGALAAPAPAAPAAPAPAAPAPAVAAVPDPLHLVKQYITLGYSDDVIAQQTGLDPTVIANVRAQA